MRLTIPAAAVTAALLAGCAGFGVEDWGDKPAADTPAVKIAAGETKLVHTPPGDHRQVWSVLMLLDARNGAYVRYGETDQRSDLIETGLTPNYVRIRSPGGAPIRVENTGKTREVNATFLVEWREFVD